jgi:hypothetical protein
MEIKIAGAIENDKIWDPQLLFSRRREQELISARRSTSTPFRKTKMHPKYVPVLKYIIELETRDRNILQSRMLTALFQCGP